MTEVYVLFYHVPQENPSFHGVFTECALAQQAADATRILGGYETGYAWETDSTDPSFTVSYTPLPPGVPPPQVRMPMYYTRCVTLNQFEGEDV